MTRIVIYINSMNASGGIERVISNLLSAWSKKYSVMLLVKDDKFSFYPLPSNIKFISINAPIFLDMTNRVQRVIATAKNLLKTVNKLRTFLKSYEFDFLYTATPLNSFEFYLADHNVMKKMVISEHASAFAVNKIYQKIKMFLYPNAYCISVPNKMDCDVYDSWGCNTVYIPHLTTFSPQKRNMLNTHKIVLNVGRLTADKRQADLLQIWSQIKDKKGWKLRIVGSGEEKEKLLKDIEEFNLSDSVEMIEHTKNIEYIYQEASIFAFTSRMEGFGMVLLEAMSFGIPCISYDCPSGPRDVIQDGVNGFLIKNGNDIEFAQKLNWMIEQPNLHEMQKQAYKTIERWNNDEILEKWEKVFSVCIEK